MAVEDKYIDTNTAAGKLTDPWKVDGNTMTLCQTFEVAIADDDGSVYRLARLNGDLIPASITIMCDAITGSTDWDLGLYKPGVGAGVKDKDVYMDGQTFASASRVLDGLQTLAIEKVGQEKVYVSAGDTTATRNSEYDLCLTANTVGAAAGTVTVIATFVKG